MVATVGDVAAAVGDVAVAVGDVSVAVADVVMVVNFGCCTELPQLCFLSLQKVLVRMMGADGVGGCTVHPFRCLYLSLTLVSAYRLGIGVVLAGLGSVMEFGAGLGLINYCFRRGRGGAGFDVLSFFAVCVCCSCSDHDVASFLPQLVALSIQLSNRPFAKGA